MPTQRRRVGDIVAIPLSDAEQGYALILDEPLVALLDIKTGTSSSPSAKQLESARIITRIWVMNHAITKGRWKVIGSTSVSNELRTPPAFFKQDPINGELSIERDGIEEDATREDCEGLECAAVWEPQHVEDRLRDHFHGVPNKWVRSLAIKPHR